MVWPFHVQQADYLDGITTVASNRLRTSMLIALLSYTRQEAKISEMEGHQRLNKLHQQFEDGF